MHSTRHLHAFALWILTGVLLAGCSSTVNSPSAVPFSSPTAPVWEGDLDLESYFDGNNAAVVIYDLKRDHYSRYNSERCAERLLPASTFKILNSLIGLETDVIPDETYVIPWDGTQYPIASWNQDHTLQTAIENSVVWYYQELARRVGRDKMRRYIDAAGYGNRDISGPIDAFWLDGSLQISADEQVKFLKRLYQGDLPFSQRSLKIVKKILVLEQTDTYELSGKTGSGQVDGVYVGWFVGYIEKDDNAYMFAANITGAEPEITGAHVKAIMLTVLQDLELLSSDCGCS